MRQTGVVRLSQVSNLLESLTILHEVIIHQIQLGFLLCKQDQFFSDLLFPLSLLSFTGQFPVNVLL